MAKNEASDFSALLQARRQRQQQSTTLSEPAVTESWEQENAGFETNQEKQPFPPLKASPAAPPYIAPVLEGDSVPQPQAVTQSERKVGRPKGRRSNPNVSPLNILVDEDLVLEVRFKLGKENKGRTPKKSISDLVEELLRQWVAQDS
jgi:hypothetical protein